jgi:ankyrin repeat protein
MDSATVQLAELISTGEGDFTCPWYTTSLLDKIATLLDKRADINIAVCVYRTTSDPICRLLGSNPVIDSIFQRRSNGWCPADDASKFQHLGAPKLIATPLIDAADQDNREAISFFAQRGARIAPILERLSPNWISIDRLWGRFSFPGRDTRHQSIQKILDLADPKNAVVQRWVQEAFNAAVASGGDEDLALMLLRHGAQPTSRKLDSSKSSRAVLEMARLPAALSTSNPAFIRLVLLDNVNSCALVPRDESCRTARGPFGITPLIVAVGNASAAMCKFLLDSGANPNEYDDFGMTALMEAIHYGHEEAVNLLLAHGAETQKVEVRSIQSSPAASSYFRSDNQWNERVEYARICKKKGWHALHLAAYQGRSNTLRALCDAGAQVAALDDSGYSPLDVAMHNSQDMAAYYLLSRKCPFDSKSPAVSRLLTQAVTDCKHGVVGQLIESGVLLSPGFGLRGEHAEIEKLSKMKERSLSLLPTRVIGMDPLKDHEVITVDLCVDCSMQLTTAKFGSTSKPNSCCKFCQLLADCSHESTNHSVKVLYSMENGAKGDELVTVSPELTFRHPIKKVQGEIFNPCLSHTLELIRGVQMTGIQFLSDSNTVTIRTHPLLQLWLWQIPGYDDVLVGIVNAAIVERRNISRLGSLTSVAFTLAID